jgi:hypothetical protein
MKYTTEEALEVAREGLEQRLEEHTRDGLEKLGEMDVKLTDTYMMLVQAYHEYIIAEFHHQNEVKLQGPIEAFIRRIGRWLYNYYVFDIVIILQFIVILKLVLE